jgi:REP element-mobilizing transposase RayT
VSIARIPIPPERDIIVRTILFWHEKRWFVHALTVMPNHVHILAQPVEKSPGIWYPLRGLMHSVKRTTAWETNRARAHRWAGPDLMDTSIARTVLQNRGARDERATEVHERV